MFTQVTIRIQQRKLAASLILIYLFILTSCQPRTLDLPPEDPNQAAASQQTPGDPTVEESPAERTADNEPLVFDADHMDSGLTLHSGGDVDVELVSLDNVRTLVFRTGSCDVLPAEDGNEDFDVALRILVNDDLIYKGLPTSRVEIEVEYLDQGRDQFNIQYDSVSGDPFTNTEWITKTGTDQFKTALFTLEDAFFGNRQGGGDFRIWDQCDGPETIRRITLRLLEPQPAAADPDPTPPASGPSSVVFHNGSILTMADGGVANAIEIQGEQIIAVGEEAEILANARPDALLIDLGGKTLMPGFIDTHTHWFQTDWREDFEAGQQILLAYGITTSAEAFVDEPLLHDFLTFEEEGRLRMRISLYPVHIDNCGELWGDWYWEDFPPSLDPDSLLQIPGIKMFNDGGSCNLPAVSFENFAGNLGDLYYKGEELAPIIRQAQERGYQVIIHGLGDRAIEEIMDAYEIVLAGGPNTFHHRLEHNTLVRDDMLQRYTELGLVGNIFGRFTGCKFADGVFASSPYPYNTWEWPWRSLLDANPEVHFAWHSDYPPIGVPDPMINLYGFLTRRDFREDGSVCEPPEWAADDLLTVKEALPIMTVEGAYALRRENEIGSLEAGKFADLIILSANPLQVSAEDILDIEVLMTMVAGQVEHCAPGYEDFCPE